jgi:formylglycine-generating enzyme required for sulfatase activity
VTNVSWYDARDFLTALGERVPGLHAQLPTEAQWEYACRAGANEAFAGGDRPDSGEAIAVKALRPVASGKPNRFGLFDLQGNVREWCVDDWDGREALPERAESDPLSHFGTRSVVRGGAWDAGEDTARSAARIAVDPQQRVVDIGFRLVVEDPPEVRP